MFNDRLNKAITRAEKHGELIAVLFLDLDHFKLINDTYGHSNGDLLLQFVAKRLTGCVRKSDTVSRLGGDEFTVILPYLKDKQESSIIAQKIIDSFSQPFCLEGQQFFVTTSIGISLYSFDGDDSESLVKNADIAMYHAKEQGRNKYQFSTQIWSLKSMASFKWKICSIKLWNRTNLCCIISLKSISEPMRS